MDRSIAIVYVWIVISRRYSIFNLFDVCLSDRRLSTHLENEVGSKLIPDNLGSLQFLRKEKRGIS